MARAGGASHHPVRNVLAREPRRPHDVRQHARNEHGASLPLRRSCDRQAGIRLQGRNDRRLQECNAARLDRSSPHHCDQPRSLHLQGRQQQLHGSGSPVGRKRRRLLARPGAARRRSTRRPRPAARVATTSGVGAVRGFLHPAEAIAATRVFYREPAARGPIPRRHRCRARPPAPRSCSPVVRGSRPAPKPRIPRSRTARTRSSAIPPRPIRARRTPTVACEPAIPCSPG